MEKLVWGTHRFQNLICLVFSEAEDDSIFLSIFLYFSIYFSIYFFPDTELIQLFQQKLKKRKTAINIKNTAYEQTTHK